jgi:GNAT superfamily N-acetyltransferase
MAAYRFCRTDDIALLVDALNRCWAPWCPDEPPTTPAVFKRSIRDLQVWCSSCMVAFTGREPVGVLIGAKRPSGTLIRRIAVHPDHCRHGHGRHLLASLGSKLSILGPPRMVAEVPERLAAACELFSTSGYVQEARLTDYVETEQSEPGAVAEARDDGDGRFVIPVTVQDLAANGLLGETSARTCWERSVETLMARQDELAGLAVASDERIEAGILHTTDGEIAWLWSVEDGGARLRRLFGRLRASGPRTWRVPKVHPSEVSSGVLEGLGFRAAGAHRLYTATARSH